MKSIERLDVVLTDAAHGPGQNAGLRWSQQQVEMIVHQYECVKLDRILSASIAQEPTEVIPVLII
jgi:hypothetical protein